MSVPDSTRRFGTSAFGQGRDQVPKAIVCLVAAGRKVLFWIEAHLHHSAPWSAKMRFSPLLRPKTARRSRAWRLPRRPASGMTSQ